MKCHGLQLAGSVGLAALLGWASPASAQTAPSLGAAESFAIVGGTTVTNTGPSTITGNLGLSPGGAVTGFPPGSVVSGTIHVADATALAAQHSIVTAYNALDSQPCGTIYAVPTDIGGLTLTPGVYCFASSGAITGTLTLNAQGDPNAVFIFKFGSSLTTASGSSVVIINGGSLCNVFWEVGSSATLGTTTSFIGNILALTSITLNTHASIAGRALARNGAVTLDTNVVTALACTTGQPPASCPPIALAPQTLPNPAVGVAYSQTLTASGGTSPYTYIVFSGTLPAGLNLSTGGVLSGTPTAAGSSTFTIQATAADNCFAAATYTLVIPTPVPTMPQAFLVLLALGLTGIGILRLRQRSRGTSTGR